MDKEFEFKSGNEKNNMERVKQFFRLSHCDDKKERCENFGKALGCLWAIYENRSWWNRWGLFKSGKTGLKPVAGKIKDFVKSEEGYFGKKFLSLLKVLSISVLRGKKNGVWTTSSSNGILGKEDVLDAINEIQSTIDTPTKPTNEGNAAPIPSAELPTQEQIYGYQKKKTVWGFLKNELNTKTGMEFADNLMTQASQMLLGQVKKGIISEYSSLLKDKKKVNRWFKGSELKKLSEINKKQKTAEKEENENVGFSTSVYATTVQKINEEAQNLLERQKYLIELDKNSKKEGRNGVYINGNFDTDWVNKKIENIRDDIKEYALLDALSDASHSRGRILGSIEGLYLAIKSWENEKLTRKNYNSCIQAFDSMVKSEDGLKIIRKIKESDYKQELKFMREYLGDLKKVVI